MHKHTLDLWGWWLAKHDRNNTTTQFRTGKDRERNSTKCLYLSFFGNSKHQGRRAWDHFITKERKPLVLAKGQPQGLAWHLLSPNSVNCNHWLSAADEITHDSPYFLSHIQQSGWQHCSSLLSSTLDAGVVNHANLEKSDIGFLPICLNWQGCLSYKGLFVTKGGFESNWKWEIRNKIVRYKTPWLPHTRFWFQEPQTSKDILYYLPY